MDLKSGYPFWAVKNGLMQAYPQLDGDVDCEVVVIGGGITGALIADALARDGREVVVVEQRDIAWGSTCASTALLQYEIDTPLVDLAGAIGKRDAVAAYTACARAVDELGTLARGLRGVELEACDSLYFASRRRDVRGLRDEHAMRVAHELSSDWLERDQLAERYGLDASAALLSHVAARVDPYRLAHALFARVARTGAVYDRTRVDAIEAGRRGVLLQVDGGHRIRAAHAVVAAGYASQRWLAGAHAKNRSSYAFVTDPLSPHLLGTLADTLVWETARPYLYLRATKDHRLIVGGEDDRIDIPSRRDARVERKVRALSKAVSERFDGLALTPAFAWAGTFAETDDGLPWIGPHRDHGPRLHFAMAYGGNGIVYSHLAAEIIRARIAGKRHPLARIFGFERRTK